MRKDPYPYQILVVEDNPGDTLLVTEYLEETILAPEVTEATSYKEAKAALLDHSKPFDIVLLDLTLPDKEGESLLTEMVPIARNAPIIILTGYSDANFAVKSLSLGASDYLLKDNLNPTILYKSLRYTLERNKTLLHLKASEQRYSDLFHLSPQPMWVYDLETLRFLDVNQAAIQQYGYSRDEFLSMTIKDIRPKEDIPKLERLVDESKQHESHAFQGEFRHLRKNGDLIYVDIRSNIMQYQGRKAEIVLAHDTTDRIRHMEAIEQQNAKLREIAWTQSHIMRAPVARILGLAALLDPQTSEQDQQEIVQHLLSSTNELDELIREIVKKAESMDIQPPEEEK